jgi:hypothetical protein
MKTYETRGRTVVEPPPRIGTHTSHPPAGVMRLPREWRRSESYSDDGRVVEYRYVVFPKTPAFAARAVLIVNVGAASPERLGILRSRDAARIERGV